MLLAVWEQVGAIAAVIAAVAAVATWVIGRSSQRDARRAVRYERLADARRLVREIRVTGDGARFDACAAAQRHLLAVLADLAFALPKCERLARQEWNLDAYSGSEGVPGLQRQVAEAEAELDEAVRA